MREARPDERIRRLPRLRAHVPDTDAIVHAAAATRLPSALQAMVCCSLSDCESVSRRWPLATSQSLIVRSALALASTLPSGRKASAEDRAVVAAQRSQLGARRGAPELDLRVVAAGRERLPIGRKRERVDRVAVAFHRADELSVRHVPLPHFAGQRVLADAAKSCVPSGEKASALTLPRAPSSCATTACVSAETSSTAAEAPHRDELLPRRIGERVHGVGAAALWARPSGPRAPAASPSRRGRLRAGVDPRRQQRDSPTRRASAVCRAA